MRGSEQTNRQMESNKKRKRQSKRYRGLPRMGGIACGGFESTFGDPILAMTSGRQRNKNGVLVS